MKKWLIALLTLLALSLSVAFAAEANDITEDCKFKVCSSGRKYTLMTDKKYTSYWESNKIKTPWIAITAPEGKPIAGLYVCFGNMPESWEIQTSDDGKDWSPSAHGSSGSFLRQRYFPLSPDTPQIHAFFPQKTDLL